MSRKKKNLPALSGVTLTGITSEGKALVRVRLSEDSESPIVVFVPFGAPGDVVNLQVKKKKRNYAEAEITELTSPGECRTTPLCSHFTVCGGCKLQHVDYQAQLQFKHQQVYDAMTRIAKVDFKEVSPVIGSDKIFHYRNKMEYTFSDKKWRTWEEIKSGKEFSDSPEALGFHIPGAFDKVLHIEQCFLQDPIGDEIRNFIYQFAIDNKLSFYDIRNNKGLLRTLMIRLSSTGQIMVCIQFGEDEPDNIKLIMDAIAERFPQITSLLYTVNLKLNDSMTGLDIKSWRGPDYIEEEMEGLRFRVNAKSFYQTNSAQAYNLYKVARRFAGLDQPSDSEKRPLVYDLYTGTGTIANFVARNASKVIGIEYVEEAIDDAKLNSRVNGLENTLFYAGDMKDILTDEFISRHGVPDVMIIDPPRAGMHEDVVKVIMNASPEVLVYVSCNPASQARDLALLDPLYEVTDIQPVDMFPHTHHVENVVRLEKR